MSHGASLIDTIVGVALMLLIFVGVFGAFQLSIDLVSNNKARIGATALSQEQMEYIRSLAYDSMAIVGGIPAGNVPQTETISLNGVAYTRHTLIRYMDDSGDGLGVADTNQITADSKEIKVSVSWASKSGARTISLVSRASPPGVEQAVPGGALSIAAFNSDVQPIPGAAVHIVNTTTVPAVDVTSYTNNSGVTTFIGAPQASGYQITVSKNGYSTAQTYTANAQNPNPLPGHLTVSNNQTTAGTFTIDLLANKTIRTYKAIQLLTWEDLFSDDTKVATTTNVTVSGGNAHQTGPAPYADSGEIQSNYLGPAYLYRWKEISWTDDQPAQTSIKYQVYYQAGADPAPIPNSVLSGNSTGFTTSPVDISGISTTTYPAIRLRAGLSTSDPNATPSIDSWRITYESGPEPLGNLAFTMHGVKTIGTDSSGAPIYKYDNALTTDAQGVLALNGIEADTYTITVNGANIGYDISESCLPQPRALPPASSTTTILYFKPHTANSLLVDVRNISGTFIPSASVRLYRTSSGYDVTQQTSDCGQTWFGSLSAGTPGTGDPYSITVSASGYQDYTASDVSVSGTLNRSIILNTL